ncbi:hypothetical protein BB8028_0001g09020 [Beauveria bassiana]|uniref:Uncharacterized protein n=1 Tax=Beauveria bassiana TaxID=176275 RepID=A0A2S7XY80_BEABA|nr:hypothetical protein BB8028_0001g09020 [Beauveria bassiana]
MLEISINLVSLRRPCRHSLKPQATPTLGSCW